MHYFFFLEFVANFVNKPGSNYIQYYQYCVLEKKNNVKLQNNAFFTFEQVLNNDNEKR